MAQDSGSLFFNQPRLSEAIAAIPAYVKGDEKATSIRLAKVLSRRFAERSPADGTAEEIAWKLARGVYLRPASADDGTPTAIGFWGQTLAVTSLLSLIKKEWSDSEAPTRNTLVEKVLKFDKDYFLNETPPPHELARRWQDVSGAKKDNLMQDLSETLHCLTGRGEIRRKTEPGAAKSSIRINSAIPGIALSKLARDRMCDFVFHHLSQTTQFKPQGISAGEFRHYLQSTDFEDVPSCVDHLVSRLGLRERVAKHEGNVVPQQTGLTYIDPAIWKYVKHPDRAQSGGRSARFAEKVTRIRRKLCFADPPTENDRQIAYLRGGRHSGKKSVVGDLLRTLDNGGELRLVKRDDDNGHAGDLPILCLRAPEYDYVTLCLHVLVFLERIAAGATDAKGQEQAVEERKALLALSGSAPNIEAMLHQIGELHTQHFAFFIFTDVGFSSETLDSLITRKGNHRLLKALTESRSESRFLVTTDLLPKDQREPGNKPIDLDPPTGEGIGWYLGAHEQVFLNAVEKAGRLDALKEWSIPGDLLMALAVLYHEYDVTEFDAFFEVMEAVAKWFSSGNGQKRSHREAVTIVYRTLVQKWRARGILPHLALIATSGDGMMQDTLRACTAQWPSSPDHNPEAAERPDPRADTFLGHAVAQDALLALSARSRGQFLLRHEEAVFTGEEERFDEIAARIPQREYLRLALLPEAARALRLELNRSDKDMLRVVWRLVAGQAHRRARYRHIRGIILSRGMASRPAERSVQAFRALLLSLSAKTIREVELDKEMPSLRHSARIAFALNNTVFDRNVAIKYAYFVLLRGDIDHDHRLSMSLDSDAVRLSLYVLFCSELGKKIEGSETDLHSYGRSLPSTLGQSLPSHFALFAPIEQARIIASLGTSAFFVGHRPTLIWAERRMWDLLAGEPQAAELAARVLCARIDLECQIGHPLTGAGATEGSTRWSSKSAGKPKKKEGLGGVNKNLSLDLERFRSLVAKADAATRDAALLRLHTRQAALKWLIGEAATPAAAFVNQFATDQELCRFDPVRGSVIGQGRTGRLIMATRLRHYPILSNRRKKEWHKPYDHVDLDTYADFVHANVARLSRYTGAERALTLADHARGLMLRGQVAAALAAIVEARRITMNGTASNRVRLAVLQLETAILICNFESGDQDAQEVRRYPERIQSNIEYINRITETEGFNIETLFGEVLAIKARVVAGVEFASKKDKALTFDAVIKAAEEFEAKGLAALIRSLRASFPRQ